MSEIIFNHYCPNVFCKETFTRILHTGCVPNPSVRIQRRNLYFVEMASIFREEMTMQYQLHRTAITTSGLFVSDGSGGILTDVVKPVVRKTATGRVERCRRQSRNKKTTCRESEVRAVGSYSGITFRPHRVCADRKSIQPPALLLAILAVLLT